jgi:D-galactarolactone cycloisomerase
MLNIEKVEAFVYRCPIQTPVQTSFGIMRDRPALFVRVTDTEGEVGWGEIWCNFPSVGAEHRARLVDSVFAPLLQGRTYEDPQRVFFDMTQRTAVLAIQCAEPGPIAQSIAGLDIAMWDLYSRRAGKALWRMLGGTNPTIKVYASGLNPTAPEVLASQSLDEGHRAFKLKVGFGQAVDHANLQALRDVIGNCELMVDANQAWDLATACVEAKALAKYNLNWLEEPLRADRPWAEWQELASVSPVVLAAGENLAGNEAFLNAFKSRALRVVQPDLAKWGGISSCLPLAHQIRQSGLHYCPHYLGAGVGLLASAHVLAAVGGEGRLEVDANPNPLRSLTCGPLKIITDGFCSLNEDPGLGISVNTANLREFESRH